MNLASVLARVCPDSLYSRLVIANWRVKNRFGLYHEPESRALQRFVGPGELVVDIGTNLGQYASRLSRLVGPTGKVIGFEAMPSTFQLARTILRGYDNVELHNVALSSAAGTARMAQFRDAHGRLQSGLSAVLETAFLDDPCSVVEVPCATLDTMLESRQRRVTFIKCDVEGHELEVLRGAKQVLLADRPLILCEIPGTHLEGVLSFIGALDYEAFQLGQEGLEPIRSTGWSNYFLVPGGASGG